jgi:hypothetical protein
MTITDDVAYFTTPGYDREIAHAILAQSRHRNASGPISDVQVRHLLRIGYTAGRAVTVEDAAFERSDTKMGRWTMLLGGLAAGAAFTGLLTWIFG